MNWDDIDAGIAGPHFFSGDEFYEAFDVLRAEDPVHWTEDKAGGRHFWSLTRHADCVAVLHDPILFSNKMGTQIPPRGAKPTPEYMHKIGADVRLTQQDPPLHTQLRKPLNPHFSVPASNRYRAKVTEIIDDLMGEIRGSDEVDLIASFCAELPVRVFLHLMDVPEVHWARLRVLAAGIVNPDDASVANGREPRDVQADSFAEIYEHMRADLMRRRANGFPDDTFADKLAGLKLEGELLSERWVGFMAMTIVAAGLESTRDAAGIGLRAFIQNRDQADLLRAQPELLKAAVEEVLRWSTPPRQRLRVATADTVIGGKNIKEGDWVVCWLSAANRDPDVFPDPYRFDITRSPNPHIAFSEGTHICLGRNVARVELEVLLTKFLEEYPDAVELEPGPTWNDGNNFISSLKTLPVGLTGARASASV